MTSLKSGQLVRAFLLAFAGILFALIGPFDMVHAGPFGWHIRQPAFWHGGTELIVLATLTGVTRRTKKLPLCLSESLTYDRGSKMAHFKRLAERLQLNM